MNKSFYFSTNFIKVEQPLAPFYVFKISAKKLIDICFSMSAHNQNGKLSGVQRKLKADRINQISLYSKSYNATFPSSIILSANYNPDGSFVDDDSVRWKIESDELIIPTNKPLASIIDGQHRIEGIKKSIKDNGDVDFDILCSVFIDMPFSEQAEVFSTINFNQRKVDKSIAYELFGYNLDETEKDFWSPDTLAIYYARVLNNDKDSPLFGKIYTAFDGSVKNASWTISTACIVESISLLMTTDATKDRYYLHQSGFFKSGRSRLESIKVKAPLRDLYIKGMDKTIYNIFFRYLQTLYGFGWFSDEGLVTTRTIGFLAIFELLRDLLNEHGVDTDIYKNLCNVPLCDLKKESFNFSGIGKAQIKSTLKKYI